MLVAALSLPRLGLGDARQLPKALLRAGREPQLDSQRFSSGRTGPIVEPAMAALTGGVPSSGEAVALAGPLSNNALKADGHAACLRKRRARGLRQRSADRANGRPLDDDQP
jgi:hypothetical protein